MARFSRALRLTAAATLLNIVSACVAAGPYPEGWEAEDAYWQGNYANEPYYAGGYGYNDYQPAYLFGVESYHRYNGRRFEDINDEELRNNWQRSHAHSTRLDWEHARPAVRASYNHVSQHASSGHENRSGGEHHG